MSSRDRPNILLITTDQQRFDTINALGNGSIHTPHLNWLVRQGVCYRRAYADCPVCMPSRATIMTGRHAYHHGMTANAQPVRPMEQFSTLPATLGRAGYQTKAIGKMHFQPMRAHYGFDHMELPRDFYKERGEDVRGGVPMDHGVGQNEHVPVIATTDERETLTHWIVRRSQDFLDTRDPTRPFFLWTSFTKPHPPFDAPQHYWDLYDGITIPSPVRGDWSASYKDVPQGFLEPTYVLSGSQYLSEEQLLAAKRSYYACISQIDYNLGLLFSSLREQGLLENTWILFTSDHGEMLGDHGMTAKSVPFEGSAHVPLLIRPPGGAPPGQPDPETRRNVRCDRLACLADIFPTCAALGNVPMPDDYNGDGLDLLALYEGQLERPRLMGECASYHYILEGSYKYAFTESGGGECLFNLAEDPAEQCNLSNSPKHAERLQSFRGQLLEALEQRGHPAASGGVIAVSAAPQEGPCTAQAWPGFHTRSFDCDVLH